MIQKASPCQPDLCNVKSMCKECNAFNDLAKNKMWAATHDQNGIFFRMFWDHIKKLIGDFREVRREFEPRPGSSCLSVHPSPGSNVSFSSSLWTSDRAKCYSDLRSWTDKPTLDLLIPSRVIVPGRPPCMERFLATDAEHAKVFSTKHLPQGRM